MLTCSETAAINIVVVTGLPATHTGLEAVDALRHRCSQHRRVSHSRQTLTGPQVTHESINMTRRDRTRCKTLNDLRGHRQHISCLDHTSRIPTRHTRSPYQLGCALSSTHRASATRHANSPTRSNSTLSNSQSRQPRPTLAARHRPPFKATHHRRNHRHKPLSRGLGPVGTTTDIHAATVRTGCDSARNNLTNIYNHRHASIMTNR